MSAAVPESDLTSDQLLKLSNFRRELADALDEALVGGGGGGGGGASTVVEVGELGVEQINNWAPAGIADAATVDTVFRVQAADDHGSLITGIDSTGLPAGTKIRIINSNTPQDAGVVAFSAEDASSDPNNRIWTPSYGRNSAQTATERYTMSPSGGDELMLICPDPVGDPTGLRWLVMHANSRPAHLAVKQFGLYPYCRPATITGTVHNWDPSDSCPSVAGEAYGSCEAGSNVKATSYTVVIVTTEDATGATLTGLKYTGSQTADGQGPVKLLYNFGPGPLTLPNTHVDSDVLNKWQWREGGQNTADIVLQPGEGLMVYHLRDVGGWLPIGHSDYLFDARDVNMEQGLRVNGTIEDAFVGATGFFLDNTEAGRTLTRQGMYLRDNGTYDCTAGGIEVRGQVIAAVGTRSAGGGALTNVACLLAASGAQNNYALQTTAGGAYFGVGAAIDLFWVNNPNQPAVFRGAMEIGGTLMVGGNSIWAPGTGVTWTTGSGSPEGVVTALGGSIYSDVTGYRIYHKHSAAGNTGWVLQ